MSDTAGDTASGSLSDLLAPISDYKSYIIVFFISTIFSSLGLTYVYSEKYMAATTIVFRPQEVTRLRQKEALAFGAPLPTPPFDLIYDNLQLLVQSEPILFRVIDELGLDIEKPKIYEGPRYVQLFKRAKDWVKELRDNTWTLFKYGRFVTDDPATAALKGLRKNLSLINNNSYVFYLYYIDKDPERAALVVDKVAENIVRSLLEDEQEPGSQRRNQLRRLRDAKLAEIEQYQSEIEELLTRNNVASISLQIERTTNRYSELSLEQVRLKSKIAGIKAKLAALEEKGANRQGASAGLQPGDYRRLKSEELFTGIELRALNKQNISLQSALSKLERKLSKLPIMQHQYDSLVQNLKTAQRDFIQISDPYHEAEVQASSVLSQAVAVHKARVPSIPVSPIKVYHVALAGGLALSISFGMAYLLAFARSEHVAQIVSRSVGNVVSMWDGVERRTQRERRRPDPPPYSGPARRKQSERRK